MITTWKENEFQGRSLEGLITLKTMGAAVKQVTMVRKTEIIDDSIPDVGAACVTTEIQTHAQ